MLGDVGHLVSMQCPRLRELEVSNVGIVIAAGHISISSTSLQRLVFGHINDIVNCTSTDLDELHTI